MPFDAAHWRFPVEELQIKRAVVCLSKDKAGQIYCVGARLDCRSLLLPEINAGYERSRRVSPEISLELPPGITSLAALAGRTFDLGQPVEGCPDDLGSVYLFGAHNPVGWQRLTFGPLRGKTLEGTFELFFDFSQEDRIGGRFHHTLRGPVRIERRWEL